MASLGKRPANKNGSCGKYYIRIYLSKLKRTHSIPTGTKNKAEAEKILKRVEALEYLSKTEQSTIIALYEDIKSDRYIVDCVEKGLGIDQSVNLCEACEIYLTDCRRRLSENSIVAYDFGLGHLIEALGQNTRITEIDKQYHQPKLMDYLQAKYDDASTVNSCLRTIRAFFYWLEENGYIYNIPFKVKLLKDKKRFVKYLKPDELQAIYNNTDSPIMISCFKVYEGTGMRAAELQNSTLEGSYLRIIGKGDKERLVPLPELLMEDYRIAKKANYNPKRISIAFKNARRKAGIEKGKSLHSLRHTYALKMWAKFGDIKMVQEALGHESVTTTERYTLIPKDYLKSIYDKKINAPVMAGLT
jgi:integrase/recombinase XerC